MKKQGYILYDVLVGMTIVLLFAVPIAKAGVLTQININGYAINHSLNEQTDKWISRILSQEYILESDDYKIQDEGFMISLVSEETEYESIKKINISVSFEDGYKNSAIVYKYTGDLQ